jgi:hypothetical protein
LFAVITITHSCSPATDPRPVRCSVHQVKRAGSGEPSHEFRTFFPGRDTTPAPPVFI